MQHYAEQDQIDPGRERLRAPEIIGRRALPDMPEVRSTPEIVLQLYFASRLSQQDIAKTLYISKQYVSRIIQQSKKIIAQNLKKQPKTG